MIYSDLLKGATTFSPQFKLLQRLVANIDKLRTVSTDYQRSLDKDRIDAQDLSKQNKYQSGDYVMFDTGPKPHPKMSSRHRGPYRVIYQEKYDVQVSNLTTDDIHTYSAVMNVFWRSDFLRGQSMTGISFVVTILAHSPSSEIPRSWTGLTSSPS